MKKLYSKIPAMIAMLIAIFSLGLLITAFIVSINEVEPESGVSKSFAFWVYAVITSMLSLIFYFVDAVISVVKAFLRIHPIFNIVLALLLVGAIPMMLFVGAKLGINIYIYFSYYLAMLILEIVSIIKHIKMTRDSDGRMTLVDDDEMTPLKAPRIEKRLDAPDPFRLK